MSTFKWIGLSIAAACAVVGVLAWQGAPSTEGATPAAHSDKRGPGWFQSQAGASAGPGDQATDAPGMRMGQAGQPGKGSSPLDAVTPPRFAVNAQGQLELNAQTRDGIEQVAALHGGDRDKARAALAEATQDLPAGAQRAVQDLYQRYQQYMQAVRQAFPPEQQEHMSLPQAEEAFDRLRAVRESYMGEEAAKALWAPDDAVTRKIFEYAAPYLKQHPNATLMEATQAAQERYTREMDGLQGRPAGLQPPPERPGR